jgi:hypothetical protein
MTTTEMDGMTLHSMLALLILTSSVRAADIQTLSGKKLSGDLLKLDKQSLTLKGADGEIRHLTADVLLIGLNTGDATVLPIYSDLELIDGSVLHCTKLEFKPQTLDVTAGTDLQLSVPYSMIATLCKDAHDPKNRLEFQQLAAKRGRFDVVAIRSEGRLNALEGTLGGGVAPGDGIEFTIQGTEIKTTPKLAKIAGLVFVSRPNPNAATPMCKVHDLARNSLVAANVEWTDKSVDVTTVAGLKVTYPKPTQLARLDFSQGKLTYLSDLDPARAETILATEDNANYAQFVRYRRDKNLDNGPIRIDGAAYAKGLTLHSGTTLVYELGGEFTTLRGVLGVDESVQTESKVEVVVEVDGQKIWSGVVSRRDAPKPLNLEIKGARQLRIDVRPTGLLEFGGEVSFADARVSK